MLNNASISEKPKPSKTLCRIVSLFLVITLIVGAVYAWKNGFFGNTTEQKLNKAAQALSKYDAAVAGGDETEKEQALIELKKAYKEYEDATITPFLKEFGIDTNNKNKN